MEKGNNPTIAAGHEIQAGKFFTDANGVSRPIFRKLVSTGALPNATGKNVAHGISNLNLATPIKAELYSTDGTTSRPVAGDPVVTVTATNVVITATANLSAQTSSWVMLEYCKTV